MDCETVIKEMMQIAQRFEDVLKDGGNPLMENVYKHNLNAYNLAIKALEENAFFENEVDHISDWFVSNKDQLLDTAFTVATESFNQYNENGKIDEVDLEFIVSDIVDEIQKGILNVLSSYGNRPYSEDDYTKAKSQGLDLDNWAHYERFYELGEDEHE